MCKPDRLRSFRCRKRLFPAAPIRYARCEGHDRRRHSSIREGHDGRGGLHLETA